jgi:kynureninase
MIERSEAAAADAADPLAAFRSEFVLPEGVVYLAGHSLGAMPRAAVAHLGNVVAEEWGRGLVGSWSSSGWIDLPERLGADVAKLLGADPGEVVVGDSTTVNLFKLLAVSVALRPGRRVIVSDGENFPTDLYVAQGIARMLDCELRLAGAGSPAAALDSDVAVLTLSHVGFRDGRMHDLRAVTQAAHESGAVALWDLSHSAGVVPLALSEWDVDLAVGCSYKYLNGGPGAPAYLYVARRLQAEAKPLLAGWMGHEAPFAMEREYRPAAGIRRHLAGTPPVLSAAAMEPALAIATRADILEVRRKSMALADLFITLVEERCGPHGVTLATPREPERRGSQVCFRHPEAYPVMRALNAMKVIGDFREPDILRFGLAPLYTRYADVWDAAAALAEVLETRGWDRSELRVRRRVT